MRTVRRLLTAALLLASATPSELYAQRSVVIVPPGVDIRHPRISGDGSTIAYSLAPSIAGSFPLRLVRGDGSQLFAVPSVSVGNVMALSDDGRLLVYDGDNVDNEVWILDTRTLTTKRLSEFGGFPTITGDGSLVAYEYSNLEIGLIHSDGSNPRVITPFDELTQLLGPAVTADGSTVFFDCWDGFFTDPIQICRMDTAGGAAVPLTSGANAHILVRASDDGSRILYNDTTTFDDFAANGDGSGAINLSAAYPPVGQQGPGHVTLDLNGDGRIAVYAGRGHVIASRTDGTWRRQIGIGSNEVALTSEGDVVVYKGPSGEMIAAGIPGVVPGEIFGLSFDADAATLTWEGRSSANVVNLYRGAIDGLRFGTPGACLAQAPPASTATDAASPVPGMGWYYLATGENGAGEGDAGAGSSGAPRAFTGSCPPSDADSDGLIDAIDPCPWISNGSAADADGDGLGDACDNCPAANPDQIDLNDDGVGEGAPPVVQVSSPNGGETLSIGAQVPITWASSDDCVTARTATIELSRAGPGGPFETIVSGIPDTGSYLWTVTGPATQGPKAYVRVTISDGSSTTPDLSDSGFRIH